MNTNHAPAEDILTEGVQTEMFIQIETEQIAHSHGGGTAETGTGTERVQQA